MCSVTLKPEQTVPAVGLGAVAQQFRKNIMGLSFKLCSCTLLIFGCRGLPLTFVGKGAQRLLMQEGSGK